MDTDLAWEQWGARDPYFGVLTDAKFRSSNLTLEAREEFFSLGAMHVRHVLDICRRHFDAGFSPRRVLDFGCGVGRLVVPFSREAKEVVGVDVSPSMLAEAARNCKARDAANVSLVASDNALSAVPGLFDLVHSCIVLQHIEVQRGRALFAALVDKVSPGGCGVLQVTFGWEIHPATYGAPPVPPVPAPPGPRARLKRLLRQCAVKAQLVAPLPPAPDPNAPDVDPEMQMNFYSMNDLLFILMKAGIARSLVEFTNHGGALGAYLIFQRDSAIASA